MINRSVLLTLFLASGFLMAEPAPLSPEGMKRQNAHAFLLGDFSKNKKRSIKGSGASEMLEEIIISTNRIEVDGSMDIILPAGTQRVAGMFRYIILRGENLDQLGGVTLLPYAPGAFLSRSTQQPGIYRMKVPSMPIPEAEMPLINIVAKAKAGKQPVITSVSLHSQGKLSTTFDTIPYRNLGAEFPRTAVNGRLDLSHELSVGGHIDLERSKFCRYYAAPGGVHPSFEVWAHERNFLPGRQILKFQPSLVVGYGENPATLKENPDKPGVADLSFFERSKHPPSSTWAIKPFRDIDYAMCFNDYPEFMSVEHVGRGTPLRQHFGDAADLAAAYVASQIRDGGRSATWWEVKNEATIKSEWDYHWREGVDAWSLMAEFHNKVAKAVHAAAPQTNIGGPSSAWMQVQVQDFALYRNHLKFMDLTKDHLDFYSHHFYEDFGSLGAWERREGKYNNYLLGRMEAILDMFAAHMHGTDNVKPILITECGSLQPGRAPSDYWLRIRSWNAYMHKLMQRPQQIDLAVPFAFLCVPWNPTSGNAAFIPKEGKHNHSPLADCEPTPVTRFFDLWRDFDGRRLPVAFEHPGLDVTAVYQGKQVQIAATNMGGRRLALNLAGLGDALKPVSISQRRLYYRDGELHYEDAVRLADLAAVPIDVEETTIITLQFAAPLEGLGLTHREFWYAAETARKPAELPDGVELAVQNLEELRSARLVVGVQREGGLTKLNGTFNGRPFVIESEWTSDMNHLFAPLQVDLPIDQLQARNVVKVDPVDGLTITSLHVVTER